MMIGHLEMVYYSLLVFVTDLDQFTDAYRVF